MMLCQSNIQYIETAEPQASVQPTQYLAHVWPKNCILTLILLLVITPQTAKETCMNISV